MRARSLIATALGSISPFDVTKRPSAGRHVLAATDAASRTSWSAGATGRRVHATSLGICRSRLLQHAMCSYSRGDALDGLDTLQEPSRARTSALMSGGCCVLVLLMQESATTASPGVDAADPSHSAFASRSRRVRFCTHIHSVPHTRTWRSSSYCYCFALGAECCAPP